MGKSNNTLLERMVIALDEAEKSANRPVAPRSESRARSKRAKEATAKVIEDSAWDRAEKEQLDLAQAESNAPIEAQFDAALARADERKVRDSRIADYERTKDAETDAAREVMNAQMASERAANAMPESAMKDAVARRKASEAESAGGLLDFDSIEFDEEVPGDFKDMGRTAGMREMASEKFGGEFPDVYAKKSEPVVDNVTTVTGSPPPVAEKAKFDGAAILDEADIARRSDVPQDKLAELFKKTHGGSFDPKSKVDKEKMAAITSMIQNDRSLLNLSPTKFALKVYASKK